MVRNRFFIFSKLNFKSIRVGRRERLTDLGLTSGTGESVGASASAGTGHAVTVAVAVAAVALLLAFLAEEAGRAALGWGVL